MKKRLISTDFRSDGWVEGLDPIEKLLYIYIFSNDKCSWSGCTEISIKKMGYETGVDRDMVDKIIKRFEEAGKVKYVDGYLLIRNFLRHHFSGFGSPDSRAKNNQIKAIKQEMLVLPKNVSVVACGFIEGFYVIYKSLGIPLEGAMEGIVPSSFTSTSTSTSTSSFTSTSDNQQSGNPKNPIVTIPEQKEEEPSPLVPARPPSKANPEIDELIKQIKLKVDELGLAYDKTQDRNFAKHILTAKEYGDFAEKLNKSRVELALSVIGASVQIGFWKGPTCGPKSIYQNYADVYNQRVSGKGQKQSNVLVV